MKYGIIYCITNVRGERKQHKGWTLDRSKYGE